MIGLKSDILLPVAFVFHPEWWHKNYGLCFSREFFYDPDTRVEADLTMRKILHERFGKYNIEKEIQIEPRPCIGAIHLTAGYIISEMFGCEIKFSKDSSPQVIPKNITDAEADKIKSVNFSENKTFQELKEMIERLKGRYGASFFDVGWGSDISLCRQKLPEAFLNLRYNPVKIRQAQPDEVSTDIQKMLEQSAVPERTGVCCINMGWDVPDENIRAIINTVAEYRKQFTEY